MTLNKTCIECGEPSEKARCRRSIGPRIHAIGKPEDTTGSGINSVAEPDACNRFCSDCGTVEDLESDHLPTAWERKAQGKPLRLADVDVVCGACNRKRGSARPGHTRGRDPSGPVQAPAAKAKFQLHTGGAKATKLR